jgi:hypothetical protein
VATRQDGRWAHQTAAPPPAPPPDSAAMIAQLTDLGRLREAGLLSEDEFNFQKARILHGF